MKARFWLPLSEMAASYSESVQ